MDRLSLFPSLPSLLLLSILAALSGCAGLDGGGESFCETADATDVVDAVHGTDIAIDGGDLVLHASESRLQLRDAAGCRGISLGEVRPGDRLAHDADEIAESFPAQAWPENVVVVR